MEKFVKGDTVKYSNLFIHNTMQYELRPLRGTVLDYIPEDNRVDVQWDNGKVGHHPARILIKAIQCQD